MKAGKVNGGVNITVTLVIVMIKEKEEEGVGEAVKTMMKLR